MADKTRNVPLPTEQEQWYATACERLNPERLKKLLLNLIDIHSSTGAERQASEFIASYMREHLGEHSLCLVKNRHGRIDDGARRA